MLHGDPSCTKSFQGRQYPQALTPPDLHSSSDAVAWHSVEHHSSRGSKSRHAHLIIVTGRVAGERLNHQVDGTDAVTVPEDVDVEVPIGLLMVHVLVEEGQHDGSLPVSHPCRLASVVQWVQD